MAVGFQEIAGVLRRARRRAGRIAAAAALGYGLAAAGGALFLGALGLGLGLGPWVRPAALAVAALSVLVAAAWLVRHQWKASWGLEEAARKVARGDPGLRSDLLSSVELARDRDELARTGRFSVALVDAHLERTSVRASALDLAAVLPFLPARRGIVALGGVALLQAAAFPFLSPQLRRGYARLLGPPPAAAAAPRQDPITGDIEITYLYPAHTGREERKVPGTGGDVTAPRGTEVRLVTRSDRPVQAARLVVETAGTPLPRAGGTDGGGGAAAPGGGAGAGGAVASAPRGGEGAPDGAAAPGPTRRAYALQVKGGRDLEGSFLLEDSGTYRFQFVDPRDPDRVLVQGAPIPVVVEPDAFPEVRIVAPAGEVEVNPDATVRVEWTASDDYGLSDLALVVKPPAGEERRRPLRTFPPSARRDGGVLDLEVAPLRLGEGETLLYWLEVRDNDAVSGPKRAASATRALKIYSEAEHHRRALEEARKQWEEMVRLLADRLEELPAGKAPDAARLARGEALDARTRVLHERLREVAQAMRKDRAAPKEIPAALTNVAAGIRAVEQRLTASRQTLSRWLKFGRPDDLSIARRVQEIDAEMDRELEKDVLYLEQLFDKQRAEDLVRIAKDLAARRRDLAGLLERYRQAPTEEGKKELLAQISRLKARMQDMMRQMAELARGVSDRHMNEEALAELAKGKDALGGLDRVEELLAKGDVDGAMKELDALGSAMQEMLSSLQRTAGQPDERNAALMKEMLRFKEELAGVRAEQEKAAAATEQVKARYRQAVAERLRQADATASRLEKLAGQAREELRQARPGTGPRSEDDYAQARDRLDDLQRALAVRDLDASLDVAKRALPPLQRLAGALHDDAFMAERYATHQKRSPEELRRSADHAAAALPPVRQVREELEKLFPDPRTVLPRGEQQKLDQLAQRQRELEQRAGRLQQQLEQLSREAPVFPPQAMQSLGEGRGHMAAAAEELGRRNPQRGHGQQREALDALGRLEKGLEEMARRGQGQGGPGFPFPFGDPGSREGEGREVASREKVEIPGAEAYKVPEEYRKDLLEAMKQGTPEPYRGEVKRYYEELVK